METAWVGSPKPPGHPNLDIKKIKVPFSLTWTLENASLARMAIWRFAAMINQDQYSEMKPYQLMKVHSMNSKLACPGRTMSIIEYP